MAQGLTPEWPECDPKTVAPLSKTGSPDMYNYQPTRFVTLEEAKARGWTFFWKGERCNYGHRAARYTSNTSVCTDCRRIEKGKVPVYVTGVSQFDDPSNRARSHTPRAGVRAVPETQLGAGEKLFLEKYSELKDWDKAANACGRAASSFLAILSWNQAFREAVNRLEEELGVMRTRAITEEFVWDEVKRNVFLEYFANTADMVDAQKAIGCTNMQFHRELESNPVFAAEWEAVQPIANKVFDWKAASLGAAGDSKILQRIVSNLYPEKYSENMKMDLNVLQRRSPEQLNGELTQVLERLDRAGLLTRPDPSVVDAEFVVSPVQGQIEGPGAGEAEAEVLGTDPNSDLVS